MNDKVKKEIERLKKADAVDIVSEILSKEIDILKRCLLFICFSKYRFNNIYFNCFIFLKWRKNGQN